MHIAPKSLAVFGTLASAMLAAHASPDDATFINPEWANSAWYIGAGVGQSRASIDQTRLVNSLSENGASVTAFSTDERDTGYKLFVGRQLNRYLALEAGYFDLGKFSFRSTTSGNGTLNGEAGFRGVNLDLLAQLPLTERLSLLGRVGGNYVKTTTRFSGNRLFAAADPNPTERKGNLKAGFGLEYKFSEALALRGEVERYRVNDAVGNRGDADLYSVSLVYKLGRPASAIRTAYVAPPAAEPAAPPPVVAAQPAPVIPAPAPVSEKVSFAAEALFDFDRSAVKPEGKAALSHLLTQLKGMDTEVMITVGHTDSVGTAAYNQKLSLQRADAVKAYLVSQGMDATRVYTEGKGETLPLADNGSSAGRARNRRVVVEVVGTRTVAR